MEKHSKQYARVKKWYDAGLWPLSAVRLAVEKGWITADEFKEITGQDYGEAD